MDCPIPSSRVHADEQLTVTNAVKQLTAAKYDGSADSACRGCKSQDALVQVQGDAIYYTLDGTTPAAANGKIGYVGSLICLRGYAAIKAFKAIRVTTDAEIDVDYFR